MDLIKAIIIAIFQGIGEFLPISSSGHIILLKKLLSLDLPQVFDVFLHMGTLVAVIIVFRKEIYELIYGLFKEKINSDLFGGELKRVDVLKIWGFLIIATIPGVIAGGLFSKLRDMMEPETIQSWMFFILGSCFLITALLLLLTHFVNYKNPKRIIEMSFWRALVIGTAQGISAMFPGISRFGSTIVASLLVGVERKDAGRFSFLMSIPIIFLAFMFDVLKIFISHQGKTALVGNIHGSSIIMIYGIGFIIAFIVGYFALKLSINLITKGRIWLFSIYLVLPAVVSIIFGIIKK